MDAYGLELVRIRRYQDDAVNARLEVFRALAAAGVPAERADELVARLEAGAVAGAHTWIAESSAPDGAEEGFEDGWNAGVRTVATDMLRLADQAAAHRGRATTHQFSPTPRSGAMATEGTASASLPEVWEVLEAARQCTWALTGPEHFLVPDASEELALVALAAVREDEQGGYLQHLQEFAEQHRGRLEEMLRAYGPGSAPATHGRYFLVGQPEALPIIERMEHAPLLLRSRWEQAGEDSLLLDDLEFAWGRASVSTGESSR